MGISPTVVLVFLAVLLSWSSHSSAQPLKGVSLYRPDSTVLLSIDGVKAMQTLKDLLLSGTRLQERSYIWSALLRGGGSQILQTEVSEEGFRIKTSPGYKGPTSFMFIDMVNIEIWEQPYLFHKERHVRIVGDAFLKCEANEQEQAERCSRDLADALFVLAREARGEVSDEKFLAVVTAYRNADPKPLFPEEARRFRVQAEFAVEQKRFTDAANFYQAAMKAVPWWPEGRFNRALVLAELKRYREAVTEMRRFLSLEPHHAQARAAQDQIYKWESLAR